MPLEELQRRGFQIEFRSHAEAILTLDFPAALKELESALQSLTLPIEEIIGSGGGETKGTQRLRRALSELEWEKGTFEIKKTINERVFESQSHTIDQCQELPERYPFGLSAKLIKDDHLGASSIGRYPVAILHF